MKTLGNLSRSHPLLLALLTTVFGVLLVQIMSHNSFLYNLDTWNHYFFTRFGEPQEFFTRWVILRNSDVVSHYRSILRSNAYLLSLSSGLEVLDIFRWGSVFLRMVYLLLTYNLVNLLFGDRKIALFAVVLLLSSYYFIWRSFIYWPENFVMLFYLFAIWTLEKYRITGRTKFLYLNTLVVIGALMTHTPSVFALGLILIAYLVHFYIHGDRQAIKLVFVSSAFGVAAVSPLIFEIGKRVYLTLVFNLGAASPWGQIVNDTPRYTAPDYLTYNYFLGPLLTLLTLVGCFVLAKEGLKRNIHLIAYFLLSFLLTISLYFNLYIPTDRVQAYFLVPIIIVASASMRHLFAHYSEWNWFAPLITVLIFFVSVANMLKTEAWFAYYYGEIPISQAVNELLEADSEAVALIDQNARYVLNLVDFPGRVCLSGPSVDPHPAMQAQDPDNRCASPDYLISRSFPVLGYKRIVAFGEYGIYLPLE